VFLDAVPREDWRFATKQHETTRWSVFVGRALCEAVKPDLRKPVNSSDSSDQGNHSKLERDMNKLIFSLLVTLTLAACGTTHFGVGEEEWARLSEPQRNEVIKSYNEREKLREETRLVEAQNRAKDEAKKKEQAAEAARQSQVRADAIRRGEAGQYGDFIRVTIQGGELRFGGKHRSYAPVALTLASGEEKILDVVSNDDKYSSYSGKLRVAYNDGTVSMDTNTYNNKSGEARILFEPEWRMGKRYIVESKGQMEMKSVQVLIMIVPTRPVGQ